MTNFYKISIYISFLNKHTLPPKYGNYKLLLASFEKNFNFIVNINKLIVFAFVVKCFYKFVIFFANVL